MRQTKRESALSLPLIMCFSSKVKVDLLFFPFVFTHQGTGSGAHQSGAMCTRAVRETYYALV